MTSPLSRRRERSFELGGIARLNRMLDEALGGWMGMESPSGSSLTSDWLPPCDITEDDRSIRLRLELPGVKPEDIRLSIEDNLLSIRGEKRQVAEERNERVHRYERSYGAFERSFSLPSTVDPEKIQATYEHGVLTITVPKAERARPREISIKVSQATAPLLFGEQIHGVPTARKALRQHRPGAFPCGGPAPLTKWRRV